MKCKSQHNFHLYLTYFNNHTSLVHQTQTSTLLLNMFGILFGKKRRKDKKKYKTLKFLFLLIFNFFFVFSLSFHEIKKTHKRV